MAARPGCLVSSRSAGFGSGTPRPPVCRRDVRMAFCRHFEKPQPTLVLDGGLRQPGKSETILPTQEEVESMTAQRGLWFLSKRGSPVRANSLDQTKKRHLLAALLFHDSDRRFFFFG